RGSVFTSSRVTSSRLSTGASRSKCTKPANPSGDVSGVPRAGGGTARGSSVPDQREDVATAELLAPLQEAELDHAGDAVDLAADLLDERGRRRRRTARGQDVVDDQNPFP